jgi:hypothetical protein
MKKYLVWILVFITQVSFADSKIPSVFTFSIGSISANFTENPDDLKSTDGTLSSVTTPSAGTVSAMPIMVGYEFFPNLKRSYFLNGIGPLLASNTGNYYNLTGGANFYFTQIASNASVSDHNFEMKIIPKFRYYAGPAVGIGYLIYNAKSATKNDIMFEIGGQGGVIYTINPKWGLRAELGAARGIGVLTSSTIIKILLGTTYNLGN